MTSNRPDATDFDHAGVGAPEMLVVAGALRWARPDLTAGVAAHVADSVAVGSDLWLAASAWFVHGSAVTGDGRPRVVEVLRKALAPGAGVELDSEHALRLWAEVAAVSQDNGDSAAARRLADAVLRAPGSDAALRLDARLVLVRALLTEDGRHAEISDHLAAAAEDAALIPHGAAAAAVSLAAAAGDRVAGRVASAVARIREGLRLLGVDPDNLRGPQSARHIADALTGQWLGTLLDCGRSTDARQVALRVGEMAAVRPVATRQAAALRLAVARALASDARATAVALDEAARTAAAADVPKLEAACCVALAELAEQTAQLDDALAAMRAGVTAERRDRERGTELRSLVARLEELWRPSAGRSARTRASEAAQKLPPVAPQPVANAAPPHRSEAQPISVRESAAAAGELWSPERTEAGSGSAARGVASWWKSDGSPLGDALAAELSSEGEAGGSHPAVQATDDWLRQTIAEIDRVWADSGRGGAGSREGHGHGAVPAEPETPPAHGRRYLPGHHAGPEVPTQEAEGERSAVRRHRAEEGGGLRVAELAERARQGARHRGSSRGRRASGVDSGAPVGPRDDLETTRKRRRAAAGLEVHGEPAPAEPPTGSAEAVPEDSEGSPATRSSTLEEETAHLGLGDLLAGALAAYRGL